MAISGKALRAILRYLHVGVGVLVALLVYSPLRESAAFVLLTQLALFPALALTGVAMVQQARVGRVLRMGTDRKEVGHVR